MSKETTVKDTDLRAKIPAKFIKLAGRYTELMTPTNTGVYEPATNMGEELLKATGKTLDGKPLTVEGAIVYQEAFRDISVAGRLALGEVGVPFLEENPNIDRVSIEFDIGHDRFGETFQRKVEDTDKSGNVTTTYGQSVSYYEALATENKAPMKTVSRHLTHLAAKALGKAE
jgi:hypothetical protein